MNAPFCATGFLRKCLTVFCAATLLLQPVAAIAADVTSYTYDEDRTGAFNVGRLTSLSNASATIRYDHDENGNVVSQRWEVDGQTYTHTFTYAPNGQLLRRSFADSDAVPSATGTYQYDGAGRLQSIPGLITHISYDANSDPVATTYGNGIVEARAYDPNRRWLMSISAQSGQTGLFEESYTRSDKGLITDVVSNRANGNWHYGYDTVDRLVSATNLDDGLLSQSFAYDAADNITFNSSVGAYTYPDPSNPRPHAVTQAGGQTYSYDAKGNMVSGGGRTITYDGEDRPVSVTYNGQTTSFVYAPDGKRLKKTTGGQTTLYLGADEEVTPAGTHIKHPHADVRKSGADINWMHRDHLSSVKLMSDAAGAVISENFFRPYTYDAYGLLTETTRTDTTSHTQPYATGGESRSWGYSYTPEGRLAAVDGPLDGASDTVTFAYDGNFDLSSVTDELGHQTKILSVNGRGQPTSIEDANGLRTDLAYDRLGRLSDVTLDPLGLAARTQIAYDAIGQVTQITRADGSLLRYTYDDARRLTSVENGLGERIEFAHDIMGNITGRTIKAADSRIVFAEDRTYDELGRLLTSVGAGPRIWRHAYNRLGETTSITDPRDKSWSYAYDSLGRLIAETDPDNGGIQRAYDEDDNLAFYDDQNSVVTSFVHNGFGEVIEESSPDTGAVVYHRDNRGLVTRRTDGRGIVKAYSYDVAGRLTAVSYPGSPAENVTLTYDSTAFGNNGVGRLTGWTDEAGATGYVYDLLGRVISETRTIAGHSHTVAYAYDSNGNILTLTYPSGRIVTFERDMEGLVTAVATRASTTSEELVLAASVGWNPFGEISRIVYGNGLTLNKSFTTNYDLSAMELLEPIDGYNLFDRVYTYEDTLNLTRIKDNLSNRYSETYTYDALNRLQSADGIYGSRQYGYDGVGNRTSRTLVSDGISTTEELFRELNSNRLQTVNVNGMTARSFTYDGPGNMLTDAGSAGITGYSYNHAGRLQSVTLGGVTTGTYTYNALGQLVSRTKQNITPSGTVHYIHDLNGNLIAETDGNGNTVREYVWIEHRGTKSAPQATGAATPLAVVAGVDTASPADYLVHGDHLERPVMMTAAIRPPVSYAYLHWFAAYTPFGTLQQTMGVIDTDNRFPGQWYQLESGLHYNWHRHYDPTLGRYTQPDPLGLIDGPSRYAYALNDPTQLVDPRGEVIPLVAIGYAIGGAIVGTIIGEYADHLEENSCSCGAPAFDSPLLLDAAAGAAAADGHFKAIPKRFVSGKSSKGSSLLSTGLSKAFPQRLPFRVPTGMRRGKPIYTNVAGRVGGRLIPFVGFGFIGYDVYRISKCLL